MNSIFALKLLSQLQTNVCIQITTFSSYNQYRTPFILFSDRISLCHSTFKGYRGRTGIAGNE